MTSVKPLASMEEAWAESQRLWTESQRLWNKSTLVVITTAQALYGKKRRIDWAKRTVEREE